MASRIIHMAVTKAIIEEENIKDRNRMMFGAILPDVYAKGRTSNDAHLKISICDNQKVTYHLTRYRELFENRMVEDDLYLGYYLHLIQDLAYRDFVYNEHQWEPCVPGNIERLHNDYRLLNAYVIEKYKLQNDIRLPDDFLEEPINELYPFGVEHLYDDLKSDFTAYTDGDIFFFTKEMADSYIQKALELCREELKALRRGKGYMDEYEWAWNRRA